MGTEEVKDVKYETKFEDGTEITPYLASAYAEGFCEGDGASSTDQLKAWSYLIGTKIGYSLQGFYGRTMSSIIGQGVISEEGIIDYSKLG